MASLALNSHERSLAILWQIKGAVLQLWHLFAQAAALEESIRVEGGLLGRGHGCEVGVMAATDIPELPAQCSEH